MSGLNPKFEKYTSGFSKVYKEYFGKEPTMGELILHGWLDIKDKKFINFEKAGKKQAELLIKEYEGE